MFIKNLIQRKLAYLLQPWLLQEPELELKLGFLRSHGIAKNLRLDISALNQLLDDSSSFHFTDFRIDQLNLRISNWSAPAFNFEVQGFHVTIAPRVVEGGRDVNESCEPPDVSLEERKKILRELDPEGSALHDVMERIAVISLSRARTTSLFNLFLSYCCLQMRDINLQVQSAISDASFTCLWEIKELNADSRQSASVCFLKAYVGSLFAPSQESYFVLEIKDLMIKLKSSDHVSLVCYSTNIIYSMKLKDLQLINFHCVIEELDFSFSPGDVSIISVLTRQSSRKCTSKKSGRQLWKGTANRIRSLISTKRWSLWKLVTVVCVWLRYIHLYEDLLFLFGYPVDIMIKRSALKMSEDQVYSRSFKHQWQAISEMEKEIPTPAIALARRVVRYRAAKNVVQGKDELPVNIYLECFQKIVQLLGLVWDAFCGIFNSITHLLLLRKKSAAHPNVNQIGVLPKNSCPDPFYRVKLRKISVTVSPDRTVWPFAGRKNVSDVRVSHSDLLSFSLLIDTLILICYEDICEHRLTFSCGSFKVMSSPVIGAKTNDNRNSAKGHQKQKIVDSKTILWGKPVTVFNQGEVAATGANNSTVISLPLLEDLLHQMWSDWKMRCAEFEKSTDERLENPFVLCEIKGFFAGQGQNHLSCRFSKCCLAVGQLEVFLGYSSTVSSALLLWQMQNAFNWTAGNQRTTVFSTPTSSEDPPVKVWDFDSITFEVVKALHKLLPGMLIQVGVFVVGPQIRLSLIKDGLHSKTTNVFSGADDVHLAFDFKNIELIISPNLMSNIALLNEVEPMCIQLKELEATDLGMSETEVYQCQGQISLDGFLKVHGLNAYLDDSSELQQSQIIALYPITIKVSTLRKEIWSLGESVIAFSAALHVIAMRLSVLIFIDELSVFLELIEDLIFPLSRAINSIGSSSSVSSQNFIGPDLHVSSEQLMQVSTGDGAFLVTASNLHALKCLSEIQSVDIVIHKSRTGNVKENQMTVSESLKSQNLSMHFLPDDGFHISAQQLHIEFSSKSKDGKVEGLAYFSGLRAVIFRYVDDIVNGSHQFDLHNLLPRSLDYVYELSVSSCTLTSSLSSLPGGLSSSHKALGGSVSGSNSTQGSIAQPPNSVAPVPNTCLIVRIVSTEIYVVECTVRDILVGKHQPSRLEISLSVEDGGQTTVSCQCQGCVIFLESVSAVMFWQCWDAYLHCIRHLLHVAPSFEKNLVAVPRANISKLEEYPSQEMQTVPLQAKWWILEDFTMDLSPFSLSFLARDESGRLQELLLNADIHLDLKVVDRRKKFSFGLPQLSVLSHVLQDSANLQSDEVQIPLTSSNMSTDPSFRVLHMGEISSVPADSSCSNADSHKETDSEDIHEVPQNYILKKLSCFIAAEESVPRDTFDTLNSIQPWVGSGSISGFDVTFSLPEMKILLSAAEFSGVSSKEAMADVQQTHLHNYQEPVRNLEEIAPDGTIIAIQDVHQHMYIAVEGAKSKYRLVGAMHYSIAGVMALFRVKYHYQKLWKSSNLWFSLTSLNAKSDSGEPLQLHCNPKSGYVDISSSATSGSALWCALPCKSTSFEDDSELESYNTVEKSLFYLVNRKNNCSIAFVDGVLEFVSKPGNPFKWRVFQDLALGRDQLFLDSSSVEASKTNMQDASHADKEKPSGSSWAIPCINVTIDKFSLTINHELSETKEKFPLLQMFVTVSDFLVQVVHAKARVMTQFVVELYSFDAQRNLWSTFVNPVEVSIFYRSRFETDRSKTILHGVPVHFYARVKELHISVTELSLDILLFVIGELNLAGPYAVRSSVILANCCKVENKSGLLLLCQFSDKQFISIVGKQSTVVFLRHLALNKPPEASIASIQLAERGAFSTSPIEFSFLQTRTFVWRTRIVSKNGSKTFPGPFVVVDISRQAEDGLSIIVSPLLRIHNKTDFPIELRFQRPEHEEDEHTSFVLKAGDTIDDSTAAFDAIKVSGGFKKALISLGVGNFVFSFRPKICYVSPNFKKPATMGWCDEIKGGKAARLSGLFDRISYHVRKAFPVESAKSSFSTTHTSLTSEDGAVDKVHFLIQNTKRDVPILQPNSSGHAMDIRISPVALQEQKEIFILPTVQISNLLQLEIHVLLTDKDLGACDSDNMSKQATISSGSTVNLYANPEAMFFNVTLTGINSSCKPVNCGDWAKKLPKRKKDIRSLDMELNLGGGKYFASLWLSCGHSGILEAAILTPYTLKNNTDFGLFCLAPNQNPSSRDATEKLGSGAYSELGALLHPKSAISWFMRTNKVRLKLLDDKATEALLDLDALSGLTEIDLEVEGESGLTYVTKLGVSLQSSVGKAVPSQVVSLSPRFVVVNESKEVITVRQCYLEDDMAGMTTVNSKQRKALRLCNRTSKKRETSVFENFIRKHRNAQDNTLLFIQFQPNEAALGWSGPVCVASMGRFFLKFRRVIDSQIEEINQEKANEKDMHEFAVVTVAEEDSSLVLRFDRPSNMNLPYRIENCLHDASITYYQKGSTEQETLGAAKCVNYVWDDLTLPHKLIIKISDVRLLREINLDKVRAWKHFYKFGQHRALGFRFPLDKKAGDKVKQTSFGHVEDIEMVNLGYEVYADGLTRVLRVCELNDSRKLDRVFHPGVKMTLRISTFAINFREHAKQDEDMSGSIIVMRLGNISLDSVLTDRHKLNQIRVQSVSVEQKWPGAPFAAMLRRHQTEYLDTCASMLRVVLVLLPSSSNIRQVKYSSIVLQPIVLNLDEETLMRIVPFWRTSLSDPNAPSQQYYFDHFEIHPVKIIASFLPGDSYSSYNSTQETLRSLLHSVIKVPEIKNKTVELNGVLVTHALITMRELSIKCLQHYSWYVMRAIYMAKGSPLLPPGFASIFDDMASSSLDVFFDPSTGLVKLPGLTLGTFKLISKCIDGKGFSGTRRYFGDLGKTLKTAGSNILFAAVTEISDSVLKGAETSGFNGMIIGFHQGILKLAMEPSLLGSAFMEGGPDRQIKLDRSPGVDELYIEGYLQAMLDTMYKQEYLRVRVIENQVVLKNLPPNSTLIDEIMDRVKGFLVSKALLKGETSSSHPLRHFRGESEWKIGPTILTLCEHLFVSFAIRWLRKQAGTLTSKIKWEDKLKADENEKAIIPEATTKEQRKGSFLKWGIGQFVFSGMVAYVDGRLCRCIPNPIARRIVSGFLLSFLDKNDNK